MTDRALLQLTIHRCPVENAVAVLDVITEYGVHLEFADLQPDDALHSGIPYVNFDADIGDADRLATALIQAAPECSFTAWQDPEDEWDGHVVMYHSALGRFDGACNARGEPYVTIEAVWAVAGQCGVDRGAATTAAFADALSRRLGQPWREIMAEAVHRVVVSQEAPAA